MAVTERSTDRWANRVFWIGLAVGALLLLAIGRKQWFIQDDWSLLITRERLRHDSSGLYWLNFPQDGHWLAVPAFIWYVTMSWFGLDSYMPFLVPMIAAYLGCVVLLRVLCRRVGVTAWTTTIVCVMLAMFGSGWENLVWAVQLCYFLSLLAFLAHLLLVDHEGRLDWRDGLAALIAIIGVASSGFGPFFLFGAAVMIALRRRWWALLTVVPAGLAWLWWFVVYSSDEAAQRKPGSRARVPEFAINGITGTFDALVGALPVTGLAILGCIGVLAWKRDQLGQLATVFACTATAIVMFLGIGYERVGFGVTTASSSRYVGIAAVLLAPLLALAVDQLGRLGNPALIAGRVLLVVAVEVNAGKLWTIGSNWAQKSAGDRDLMELIAGSPQAAQVDPLIRPIPLNPDIRVRDLSRLVELGAITPRVPTTPEEIARVDEALGLTPAGPD